MTADTLPTARLDGPPEALPDTGAGAAAALAPMVEIWFRILVDHVPDPDARCRACTAAGTGERNTPWPCTVRAVAATARQRHAALAGGTGRSRTRRILRGQRGSCPMTPRELEFLQMAADGRSDPEIAEHLDVPERTVRATIRRIIHTLGVGDRSSLLVLALRHGVVV